MAKYLDDNGLLYFWQKIKAVFVEQQAGKGLSTNDYTTAEKNKLAGIASGAEVNVITAVSVNNAPLTPTNKAVNITVPTKTSDITNNSNFVADASYVHTDNNYTTTEKNKLAAFGDASTYALKSDITGLYRYKGSVASYANLPTTGRTTGDVWNTEDTGANYAWEGSDWDSLGQLFSIVSITNSEIDVIVAS